MVDDPPNGQPRLVSRYRVSRASVTGRDSARSRPLVSECQILLGPEVTTSNINGDLLAQTGEGKIEGNLLFNVAT
jgi:hypothetical protein